MSVGELDQAEAAPRCPLCCEHGRPLAGRCGWCENDYDPDRLADAPIAYDQPMWKCPHGVGADPECRRLSLPWLIASVIVSAQDTSEAAGLVEKLVPELAGSARARWSVKAAAS